MNIVFSEVHEQIIEKLKHTKLNIPEDAILLNGFSGIPFFTSYGDEQAQMIGSMATVVLVGKQTKQLYFVNVAELLNDQDSNTEQISA
jgi:hypothetical protein